MVAAAVLTIVLAAGVARADPAGSVLAMEGACYVAHGEAHVPLALGGTVEVGDTVVVPPGAKLKLRMSDGSIIAAASGTRLTISDYRPGGPGGRDAKLSLMSGLLRAVVAAVSGPTHFEVDTATGVAAVRSTDWFIEAKPGTTQVGVLAGVVSLESRATGRTVEIPARWGARVQAGMDPVPPRVWRPSEFDDVIARTAIE